jgi:hypothetical protein
MNPFARILSVVVVVVLCAGVSLGDTLVVPNSYAAVNGGGALSEPFNNGLQIRYQQVYASSEFSAFGGPKWIHGVYFRPDGRIGGFGHAFTQTYDKLEIHLSTTSVGPGTIGQNYVNNAGSDDTTVLNTALDGPVTISSAFTGPAGGPKDFDIYIPFTKAFRYDPAAGNLLIDIKRDGTSLQLSEFDFVSHTSLGRAYGFLPNPNGSLGRDAGLVTRFEFNDRASSDSTFGFPNLGGASLTTAGNASSVTVGYGRIQPSVGSYSPSGLAIFGLRQNGVLVGETGVPATPLVVSGRIDARVSATVNTGIAIVNPNDQPVTISFFFTDESGNAFGSGTMTVGAKSQTAKFLTEAPYNSGPNVSGTFTFTSSAPIAAIALRGFTNQRSEFLMTTLPVSGTTASSAAPVIFPDFADGGGWSTEVVLVNPSEELQTGNLQFFSQGSGIAEGAAIALNVNGTNALSFPYSMPPRSSRRFQTSNSDSSVRAGSVRVLPATGSRSPLGVAIFSYTSTGITVSQSGVPAAEAGTAFRVYARSSGQTGQVGSIQTGLAIASAASAASVNLELFTFAGTSTGMQASLKIPASGQVTKFLNEVFPALNEFEGVLRISSDVPVAVTALRGRYNERSDFLITTTPPVSESTPPSGSEMLFPELVDGGGYTTQFVVLSGVPGLSLSGTLRAFTQTGGNLALPLR